MSLYPTATLDVLIHQDPAFLMEIANYLESGNPEFLIVQGLDRPILHHDDRVLYNVHNAVALGEALVAIGEALLARSQSPAMVQVQRRLNPSLPPNAR